MDTDEHRWGRETKNQERFFTLFTTHHVLFTARAQRPLEPRTFILTMKDMKSMKAAAPQVSTTDVSRPGRKQRPVRLWNGWETPSSGIVDMCMMVRPVGCILCTSSNQRSAATPRTKNLYFNHEGHEEHEGGCAAGTNHRWTQVGRETKASPSLKMWE